jgi:hypothetical protein
LTPCVTLQQQFGPSDFQERVVEKQADRLRLLIVVGACGTLITPFRKRTEIVLVDVHRQPPNSAARPAVVILSYLKAGADLSAPWVVFITR